MTALNGFQGNATLAATGVPDGVTAALSAGQVNATGAVSLTLSASTFNPGGEFPITVTATNTSVIDSVPTVIFDLTITGGLPQPDPQ